ncbi:gliding motility-associated C-terminal domain-containing protein [Maribacter sp. 2210JD10-5]|uniref:gliding motility-associated C-terminal domain-containing protein n=1 Tax=Maribacter sp. 2210JD10-5 TaxID=3386272 RepID=UPI0039BD4ADE
MKVKIYILCFLLSIAVNAQTALYNNGSIRIHEEGTIGFHTNFINDAPFDTNLGLAGFYSLDDQTVSGTLVPEFYDMELLTDVALNLEVGMANTNNTNLIFGNIFTPRNRPEVYYNFVSNAFYSGTDNFNKIDGYAAITNQQNFIFPVGDVSQLRPLVLNSESVNLFAKCAYFFENPNAPQSFSERFNTLDVDRDIGFVSEVEFWFLEGNVPSTISLNWNQRSDMAALTDDATAIVPVGWSKTAQRWVNLGVTANAGTIEEGFVTSETIVPDDYAIITLGTFETPLGTLSAQSLDNYFVSVNGDGINDNFFIPELAESSPNNLVRIYDRYGLKVFEKENYTNEFTGTSNVNNFVIGREDGLPTGVYFYTVNALDLGLNYQGFLYLTR